VVDRTVTKTLVFVSSKKYVPKDSTKLKYKEYIYTEGWTYEGIVESIAKGKLKIKDKEVSATVIVFRNNQNKYALVIPESHPYYILNMPKIEEGDRIEVTYEGQLQHDTANFRKGAKIINVRRVEKDE